MQRGVTVTKFCVCTGAVARPYDVCQAQHHEILLLRGMPVQRGWPTFIS